MNPNRMLFFAPGENVRSFAFYSEAPPQYPTPSQHPAHTRTLREAIAELVISKTRANCSAKYVTSLRQYLHLFGEGRKDAPLSSFGVAQIEDWFASRQEAPVSQASNLGRLSALFSYAVRRGYIDRNPCDRIERVRVDRPPPKILMVAEAARLLQAAQRIAPDIIAYLTLGLFCGIRPEECQQLSWRSLDLAEYRVRLDRTKTRRRRVVDIPGNALNWLAIAMDRAPERLVPTPTTLRRHRRLVCLTAGLEWSQDVLRHTAASYMLARDKDAGAVAMQLGNSARILLTHYYAVVSSADAERFFSLLPK